MSPRQRGIDYEFFKIVQNTTVETSNAELAQNEKDSFLV